MADRNTSDNRLKGSDSDVASNPAESKEDFRKKYNELNSQIDNILTETMKRSNEIFMESEVGHLITNMVFNASNDGIWAIDRNHKIIRMFFNALCPIISCSPRVSQLYIVPLWELSHKDSCAEAFSITSSGSGRTHIDHSYTTIAGTTSVTARRKYLSKDSWTSSNCSQMN